MMIFRTVCENDCNSTRAAKAMNMTQPAVSLAIKELEMYYGVHLFDRIGRRLRITDTGKHFLQYAIHISDLFADMEAGLRDWDSKGILRIGASITIGSLFLPGYVKEFSSAFPGIDIRVNVEQADRLEQKILTNELDCALTEGIPHDPRIISEAYMEDRLCIIASAKSGWKQGELISKESFKKQRFLMREHGSGTREVFDHVTGQAGIHITPAWEAMSTTALINAVITGLGIAVLPYRMIQPALERDLIVTIDAEGLDFKRNFYVIHHKDKFLMPSADNFISLCKKYKDTLSDPYISPFSAPAASDR
ncbi:MAG: LysR family transcriptional regulator [Lachnospiraceae bacterium]|nr:LysR family transcriptional regulator [Lachnospiraceae bacterium]